MNKKSPPKRWAFFRETLGEATKKSYFHNLTHTTTTKATPVPKLMALDDYLNY
jgi:hypothetical protein